LKDQTDKFIEFKYFYSKLFDYLNV